MLLWEMLEARTPQSRDESPPAHDSSSSPSGAAQTQPKQTHTMRLPFDMFCCAVTKSGRRCRGKIVKGGEYCIFHDPELAAKRKKTMSSAPAKRRRKLSHLPDGYLRKLSDHRSVGQAMDRLYREIRLGIITPEMGRVMFDVLTRILDSGLADLQGVPKSISRTKAHRLRPKMADLLTRAEKAAWKKAIGKIHGVRSEPTRSAAAKRKVQRAPAEKAIQPQRATANSPVPVPVRS